MSPSPPHAGHGPAIALHGLIAGVVLFGISASLDRHPDSWFWQHANELLLGYWILMAVTLERGIRSLVVQIAQAPEGRRGGLKLGSIAFLAMSAPILGRAIYLAWHFHGATGAAEGLGTITLSYPVGFTMTVMTGVTLVGSFGRDPLRPVVTAGRLGLLLVQHVPHAILYLQLLPPFGPQAPAAMTALSQPLFAWISLAWKVTGLHVLVAIGQEVVERSK